VHVAMCPRAEFGFFPLAHSAEFPQTLWATGQNF
jgi:hypothetical protein